MNGGNRITCGKADYIIYNALSVNFMVTPYVK